MQYRWWCGGLIRKSSDKTATKYLSDIPGALSGIVVSKFVEKEFRSYMLYTSFNDYVELYDYIKQAPDRERVFHEVALSGANQKPRFDIDISLDDYKEFYAVEQDNIEDQLAVFGDWVKDLVIDAATAVLKSRSVHVDLSRDFSIYTSHGLHKRSYHIVMQNFSHRGCEQALEFYKLCGKSIANDKARDIYWKFVDGSAYNSNKSLRVLWCRKGDRTKVYQRTFNYKGSIYTQQHHLFVEGIPQSLYNKRVLAASLITFTAETSEMPLFPIEGARKCATSDLSDADLAECTSLIETWNSKGVYLQGDCEEGKIQLRRLKPSHCTQCESTHDRRPGFCQVVDGELYFHCGKTGQRSLGVWLGSLTSHYTVTNRLNDLRCARGLDPITVAAPSSDKTIGNYTADDLVFTICGKVVSACSSEWDFTLPGDDEPKEETPVAVNIAPPITEIHITPWIPIKKEEEVAKPASIVIIPKADRIRGKNTPRVLPSIDKPLEPSTRLKRTRPK